MAEITHRDALPGDIVRQLPGGNIFIHHPVQRAAPTNLAEKRRFAEMSPQARCAQQRAADRAADPWADATKVITRTADMKILVDGRPIEETQGRR